MITNDKLFGYGSVNIFTDASMMTLKSGETVGCSGSLVVFCSVYQQPSIMQFQINRNSTNNNSEIKAVRLGVLEALKYNGYANKIRLFSDSQISIFGIRDRIFNWDLSENKFFGSAGEIKNQEIFIEILNLIVENNLSIEFFHQKGHVKFNTKSLVEAKQVFKASNNIRDEIDMSVIRTISTYNDMIDNESRKILQKINFSNTKITKEPITFFGYDFDKSNYYNLIH